jgi:hypothetical protein
MEMKDQIIAQVREAIELGKAIDKKLVEINQSFESLKEFKASNPGLTFEDAKSKIEEYVVMNQYAALYIQDINHIGSLLSVLYPLVKIGEIDLGLNEEDSMLFEGLGNSSKYFFTLESGEVKEANEEIIATFKEQTSKTINEDTLKQIFSKL